MEIKQALIQCFSETSLGLSKSEIQLILEEELNKPETETDCEIVEMCVDLLARIDNVDLSDNTPVPPIALPVTHKSKQLWRTALLVVAIVTLLIASTLVVSAKVFNVDLTHYIVEVFSNRITVKTSKSSGELLAGVSLRGELANHGFEELLLPDAFLEESTISQLAYQTTDISQLVGFIATTGETTIEFRITQFNYGFDDSIGESQYYGTFQETKEVSLGDLTVLVSDLGDRRVVEFANNRTSYLIETNLDMEMTVHLVKSIQ